MMNEIQPTRWWKNWTKYQHRLVFLPAWLLGIMALLIYPGFEVKGLVFGLIIGYWPFALFGEIDAILTLLSMSLLSALMVGFCAWMMDREQVTRKIWFLLIGSILAGLAILYHFRANDFSWWQHSLVAVAMPEGYTLTRDDFNRLYLIPFTIVGGLYGIYLVSGLGCLVAVGKMVCRKFGWLKTSSDLDSSYQ